MSRLSRGARQTGDNKMVELHVYTWYQFQLSMTVGFHTFVQQDLGWDLSYEISASEEGGKKIVLVAIEVQVLFHARDIGVCFGLWS
jgi:hypothetical protein